jgi:hypothetical protein
MWETPASVVKGRPPCGSRRQRRPWCQRRLCGGQLAPWWGRRQGRIWVRVEYPEGTRSFESFGPNRADLEPYPSEAQVAVRFRGGGSTVRVRCRSEQAWIRKGESPFPSRSAGFGPGPPVPVPGRGGWRWAWAGQPCGGAGCPDDEARGASRDIRVGTEGRGQKGAGGGDGRRGDGGHRGCLLSAGYVGFGGVNRVQIKAGG